jgi:hypothetical protein
MFQLEAVEGEQAAQIVFRCLWTFDDDRVEYVVPASDAFRHLLKEFVWCAERRSHVQVAVRGHLGRDHDVVFTTADTPLRFVRDMHRRWMTQAVQARAAVLRQPIVCP